MNKWFQEGSPNSYKIQVLYQEIPQFVKTKPVDTPFRFSSYEEAIKTGQDMFPGVQFKVVGSNDRPHWQSSPIEKLPVDKLRDKSWYDLYAVAPSAYYEVNQFKKQQSQRLQSAQAVDTVEDMNFKTLQRLKTLPTSKTVHVRQTQIGQKRQNGQNDQNGQKRQKRQNDQSDQKAEIGQK